MRKCEDCRIILEEDVRFCPNCGRAVSAGSAAARQAAVGAGALLTSANLHRIRKEWDQAVNAATEALKLTPNDPDVAALLGQIYEERGMMADAVIWYEMALELNPGNEQDKNRLERIKQRMSQARQATGSFTRFQRHTRLWGSMLAAVFVIMVAFALIMALGGDKSGEPKPKTEARSNTSPIIRPEVTTRSPDPDRADLPVTAPGSTTNAAQSSARTSAETVIRESMEQSANIRKLRLRVDDVIADPRDSVAIVTLSLPSGGALNKSSIVMAAGTAAWAAFASREAVKFVTMRCVVSGSEGTQIVFVGEVAREPLLATGEHANAEQMQSVFTGQWWNPLVQ